MKTKLQQEMEEMEKFLIASSIKFTSGLRKMRDEVQNADVVRHHDLKETARAWSEGLARQFDYEQEKGAPDGLELMKRIEFNQTMLRAILKGCLLRLTAATGQGFFSTTGTMQAVVKDVLKNIATELSPEVKSRVQKIRKMMKKNRQKENKKKKKLNKMSKKSKKKKATEGIEPTTSGRGTATYAAELNRYGRGQDGYRKTARQSSRQEGGYYGPNTNNAPRRMVDQTDRAVHSSGRSRSPRRSLRDEYNATGPVLLAHRTQVPTATETRSRTNTSSYSTVVRGRTRSNSELGGSTSTTRDVSSELSNKSSRRNNSPHDTNIEFGLKRRRIPKKGERENRGRQSTFAEYRVACPGPGTGL